MINIILGLLSVISFTWSFISAENRTIAITIGFILLLLLTISDKNKKVQQIENEQKRLKEKLNIHQQLIDIKADIKNLQIKNENR